MESQERDCYVIKICRKKKFLNHDIGIKLLQLSANCFSQKYNNARLMGIKLAIYSYDTFLCCQADKTSGFSKNQKISLKSFFYFFLSFPGATVKWLEQVWPPSQTQSVSDLIWPAEQFEQKFGSIISVSDCRRNKHMRKIDLFIKCIQV